MSKYSRDDLYRLIVEEGLSYNKIGTLYNVSGAAIRKAATRLNIELPSRRRINSNETFNKGKTINNTRRCLNCNKEFVIYASKLNKYCSIKCQQDYQHKERYKLLLDGDVSLMRANYSPSIFKDDILKEQNGVCNICGMKPNWNNKELVFILDHIDGNAANNKRDNLRMICPNCDSQLDTYKSKNKNGARSYYRYHRK